MPLVKVEVRNEYGLAMPELYANREDPKALLDGVAVAGLIGILRQLGDLAQFAAEVFHGLQEQVVNTSSRSHKLRVRTKKLEAAISPLEKAILAQKSHLHFAYTNGSSWHAHIQSERNHFIYSDLPLFIIDSYEECRAPPRLHLLDKFDTGGPGSCLKRYSDPTFSRRASAGFHEEYSEKFPEDKKDRRRKKKRTWIQNGDELQRVNHGTPTSSHTDRMHYASQNFQRHTSPSQTASTRDAAVKLDIKKSFDSRSASGYEEYVFSPGYTLKSDGSEPEELSPQLTMSHSDTLHASSLDEHSRVIDVDIQEQTGARISCVTWDEKTEIVEPRRPQYYCDETIERSPSNFNPNPLEGEASNFNTDYCINESTPKPVHAANQLDNTASETDIYMDSLNTIESESETDLECQTKRELEQFSALNIKEMDRSTCSLNTKHIDSDLSIASSYVPGHISTNLPVSEENSNVIVPGSNFVFNEETSISNPSDTGKSSIQDSLPSSDFIESDDITSHNTENVAENLLSFDSSEPIVQTSDTDTVLSSNCESQKSAPVPSRVTGTNFWTNGGLLGLQPSKPPDFSALDPVNHDSMVPYQCKILDGEENASETKVCKDSKMSKQDHSPSFTMLIHDDQEDSISVLKTSLRFSQAYSDSRHKQTATLDHNSRSNQSSNLLLSETSTMVQGTEKQDNPDVEAAKSVLYNVQNSSRMFELCNKLLANGQGKVCSFSDDNYLSSFTNGTSEQQSAHQESQNFSDRTFFEQFGSGSPFMSPSSSPPLENMKISFHHINRFEVSKLKLEFPDGSGCHDSSRDVFPSFQLVPEDSSLLQNSGLDSDDDTFCDSSPCESVACLSHYSELDSEEWETRESPESNNNDIYDVLCRNSTESVSSSQDVAGLALGVLTNRTGLLNLFNENGLEHSQTDLPSFDSINGLLKQDLHNETETKYQLDLKFAKDPTPPLPPLECGAGMKLDTDMVAENQIPSFQVLKLAFDQKLSNSTISKQPKPAPVKYDNTTIIACTTNKKYLDGQKFNIQSDANQSINRKVTDANEEFVQLIRTKSLSLRRTITERPNLGPGEPANISVTAILEKANAIRQAVGSDDEVDDDSWSD